MAKIHLNRNRQSLGQFSPEEVAEGLRSGRFLPDDLAWKEGMDAWKPLSEWDDLKSQADVEPAIPSVAPGSETLLDPMPVPEGTQPAWESPEPMSFVMRFSETVRSVLGSPGQTFEQMSRAGGIGPAFKFYALLAGFGWVVIFGYQLLFMMVQPGGLPPPLGNFEQPQIIVAMVLSFFVLLVFVLLSVFLFAGLYHCVLLVFGAGSGGFKTTFRVAAYAHGATSVLLLIPFCGQYIQFVWSLVALVVGLQKAHRISVAPALAAVLIPWILFICALFGLFVAAGAIIGMAAAGAGTVE